MQKRVLYALLIMALSVLVLIFSRAPVEVNLILFKFRAMGSLVYLAFIALGITIGVLLR